MAMRFWKLLPSYHLNQHNRDCVGSRSPGKIENLRPHFLQCRRTPPYKAMVHRPKSVSCDNHQPPKGLRTSTGVIRESFLRLDPISCDEMRSHTCFNKPFMYSLLHRLLTNEIFCCALFLVSWGSHLVVTSHPLAISLTLHEFLLVLLFA